MDRVFLIVTNSIIYIFKQIKKDFICAHRYKWNCIKQPLPFFLKVGTSQIIKWFGQTMIFRAFGLLFTMSNYCFWQKLICWRQFLVLDINQEKWIICLLYRKCYLKISYVDNVVTLITKNYFWEFSISFQEAQNIQVLVPTLNFLCVYNCRLTRISNCEELLQQYPQNNLWNYHSFWAWCITSKMIFLVLFPLGCFLRWQNGSIIVLL